MPLKKVRERQERRPHPAPIHPGYFKQLPSRATSDVTLTHRKRMRERTHVDVESSRRA